MPVSRVVRIRRHGPPSVLTMETGTAIYPGAGQVVINQRAIGVNFVDVLFRSGRFPLTDFPAVIGSEAAGTVEAVGPGVSDWRAGDRAGYWTSLGAYTERRIIDAAALVPIPADITDPQAATLMAKGLSAWVFTHRVHRILPGQTVVITAAAGATGTLTAHWARRLGARVITVVGSALKADYLRAAGFDDLVISTDAHHTAAAVRALTDGSGGVDVLYDSIGGDGFAALALAVKPGGSAVLTGFAAGQPTIPVREMAPRGIHFHRPDVQTYVHSPAVAREGLHAVYNEYRVGTFGDFVPTTYRLDQAAKAHDDLEGRRTIGALLLLP